MKTPILALCLSFGAIAADGAVSLASTSTQGGYISLSTSASPQTIVAWAYPTVTNGVGRSVVAVGGANQHYNILGLSTGLGRWYCASRAAGSENYVASLTPPALNQWTHLAATFASSTSRVIWINGAAEGTNTTSTVPTLTNIGIGVRADGAFPNATAPSWFDGQLFWVAVYSAALTRAEIAQLSGGGDPRAAVSPLRVRPDRLVLFFPATIPGIPALNLVGGATSKMVTLTNGPSFLNGPSLFPY